MGAGPAACKIVSPTPVSSEADTTASSTATGVAALLSARRSRIGHRSYALCFPFFHFLFLFPAFSGSVSFQTASHLSPSSLFSSHSRSRAQRRQYCLESILGHLAREVGQRFQRHFVATKSRKLSDPGLICRSCRSGC